MDFKFKIIKDLHEQLTRGEISPVDCQKEIVKFKNDLKDLNESCEAMLQVERLEHAKRRKELYKGNKDWIDLKINLQDCWRNARPHTNENIIEQILLLPDKDLANIDLDKVSKTTFTGNGLIEAYQALESVITIGKK